MKWILVCALLFFIAPRAPKDFAPPYYGAQAIVRGVDPYSDEVTLLNQVANYGRPALPTDDQHHVAYPVSSLLLVLPFLALDIEKAALVYRVLAAFLLIYGAYRVHKSLLWAVLAALLVREPITGFMLGNMALLMAGFVTLAVALLRERRDYPAMLCLVGASISPVVGIPVAILLLWKRWYMLSLYLTLLGGLFLFSFLVAGWWLPGWIDTLRLYTEYAPHRAWMPALIPLAIILWLLDRSDRGAIRTVLLSVPLTGIYQSAIATTLLDRKRLISVGILLWTMSAFVPTLYRLYLTPLIIAIHLLDLPDLRTLAALPAATRAWAAGAFQRGSASPANAASD